MCTFCFVAICFQFSSFYLLKFTWHQRRPEVHYTAAKNIPGLLLFLDFEKAFDTLEWSFIQRTLQHFGFGLSFQKWIKVFYQDIERCVLNNGWASNFFELTRGVWQGCPLLPYLFIISAEIMAENVRKTKEFRGLTVWGEEIKLSEYAYPRWL